MSTSEGTDIHVGFRRDVAASRLIDPMPSFERLSRNTSVPVDDLVHHALVRWMSAGSEALLFVGPPVLKELFEARKAENWEKVAGIVDWLEAGWKIYGSSA